ncbi:MAG: ATP-binding protein [Bdellovibrio sp.]|nr:ATP-binding protein [Bdellovibrio sp.]
MISRICKLSKSNSFFVFGARGTGKSTLLKSFFSPDEHTYFNLLSSQTEYQFAKNPDQLSHILLKIKKDTPFKKWVIIDEIQKVPKLLDVIHSEIENGHFLFALTGSSARKLKRGQANLLAGRAFVYNLFPFTSQELGSNFDLMSALQWGTLPKNLNLADDEKTKYLRSYANTYLKEEIVAEQLVRNLQPFTNFLEVAAQTNGKIINYSKIAKDIGVESPTIKSYFDILEETYVGFRLLPFHESLRKRQNQNPKFYFFDNGVVRALSRRLSIRITEANYEYGQLFESFIIQEITRLIQYNQPDWQIFYLRTKDDFEIDVIIDRPGLPRVFIEIKSTNNISNESFVGLSRFAKETGLKSEYYILSQDSAAFIKDGISFLPWQRGLAEIGLT